MQTQMKLPNAPSSTEPRSLAPMPQVAPGMGDRDTAVLMKIRENELGIQVRQAAASPINPA